MTGCNFSHSTNSNSANRSPSCGAARVLPRLPRSADVSTAMPRRVTFISTTARSPLRFYAKSATKPRRPINLAANARRATGAPIAAMRSSDGKRTASARLTSARTITVPFSNATSPRSLLKNVSCATLVTPVSSNYITYSENIILRLMISLRPGLRMLPLILTASITTCIPLVCALPSPSASASALE